MTATDLNMHDILKAVVVDIWDRFDEDNSGTLEEDETKEFIKNCIKELAGEDEEAAALIAAQFSDEDYDECFRRVDVDGSGSITQEEMLEFIKIMANL